MASEANRDEIIKCRAVARKALQLGDKDKAVRFLNKALRMGPGDTEIEQELKAAEASTSKPAATSNASTSDTNASGSGMRQRPAAATSSARKPAPPKKEREYTADQLALAKKILRTKDYYDILGVPKGADENDCKKAFRKLALKLHPDKNGAPGADEAFKKLSTAFQCLTDADKKRIYDQYGADENNMPQHARSHFNNNNVTPQDLFEAFFGGGDLFEDRPRRQRQRVHQPYQQARDGENLKLMQIVPMLIFMFGMLVVNFIDLKQKQPEFQFHRTATYTQGRHTEGLNVNFFVGKEFTKNYPKGTEGRRDFDTFVEAHYIQSLKSDCEFEERQAIKSYRLAKWQGASQDSLTKLREQGKPACQKLKDFQTSSDKKMKDAYRRAMRYL